MDMFGRKVFMNIVFLPYALSWLITALASNIKMLYLGIVIQGIGAGKKILFLQHFKLKNWSLHETITCRDVILYLSLYIGDFQHRAQRSLTRLNRDHLQHRNSGHQRSHV